MTTSGVGAAANGAPVERLRAGSLVKICGLREPEHAVAAAKAGADLIGFVFAPARRRVTPQQARTCIEAARAAAPGRNVLAVGVFVDAAPDEIARVVAEAGIDLVQLHGDEPPGFAADLPIPALKALSPPPGSDAAAVAERLVAHTDHAAAPAAFLVDGFRPGFAGGSGARADWALAAALALRHPLLLAGGLDAGNVAAAIAAVRPLGVDVSSGVETEGVKDAAKIAAFVAAARTAFANVSR